MTTPTHLEGYHMRYSTNGSGRAAVTTSHVVADATQKTLCGRNAEAWRELPWSVPDCSRCQAKADAIRNLIPKE